ncbi:MAG: serine hydrolase [Deltaproteobacteria bacterium]|nr:serine hydrolase [Deltaproteobacteria bacterium]MBW2360280.1 serine hydrolase [Deltaproteobacteria bacterium]
MQRTLALTLVLLLVAGPAFAYPLDGYPTTGIKRLEAYRLAATSSGRPDFLTEGEMLPSELVKLGLTGRNFRIPAADPELSSHVKALIGTDASRYSVAVLDWTDPERPRYAAVNPNQAQNPGSVGKIMVLLGWFQAMADVYPDDIAARRHLLRDTQIVADAFIRTDSHKVPVWDFGDSSVERRPIAEGDRATLWTFMDWMASASSNAAASTMMKQLVLLKHFGQRYPVPDAEANAWLAKTSKQELSRIFADAIQSPAGRNGLDISQLRQGSFFTREGKSRIPGTNSTSSAASLMQFIVQMERGALVDEWSSREIKKLLYLTDKRIRYAAHPELDDAAVYFKSGSLYGCKPEQGFSCGKFRGNRINFMNSMVVIESVGQTSELRYAVVVLSNVLRKDSSALHQQLGYDIHRVIESLHR